MGLTQDDVIMKVARSYLDDLTRSKLSIPDISIIKSALLDDIVATFTLENETREKGNKWKIPTVLPNCVIAEVILQLHHVRRVTWTGDAGGGNYDLMLYQESGDDMGIYLSDKDMIEKMITSYNHMISDKDIKEVINILNRSAKQCPVQGDCNLIAVNNGIFNYKTKTLQPFSPNHIFITKSHVDYNPNAVSPTIHNDQDGTDWEVEDWMTTLSDDPEIQELLWQTVGSVIRPRVNWNRVVCFYSNQGNNGKGTLTRLMRNLCGGRSHTTIPFADFDKDFALEKLMTVSAVITDENGTSDFTKVTASLKAIITGDNVLINRKYEKMIEIRFNGIMIQCINALPKFSDKTDSLYRRFLLVPFTKCFKGIEREYIKEDYLSRNDVLEYILFKVLNMDYDKFIEPNACLELNEAHKVHNDPVRQFLYDDDILNELVWDLVPYKFLYDMYVSWYRGNNPSGSICSNQAFTEQLKEILRDDPIWDVSAKTPHTKNMTNMAAPERLMEVYNLKEWQNVHVTTSIDKRCTYNKDRKSFRGMIRR